MSAMRDELRYPVGTVRALLHTELVTPATRRALRARLGVSASSGARYLAPRELATLRAVCARLVPQPERPQPIDLAASIDERLAHEEGNGWRFATMPPDRDAYRLAMTALDADAHEMAATSFVGLAPSQQDALLRRVQQGEIRSAEWDGVPPDTFFTELLADVTECYYSHPLAQEEIGYVGMADARGWIAIGLNELEPREPRAVERAGD